jgi:hypothetical protein
MEVFDTAQDAEVEVVRPLALRTLFREVALQIAEMHNE